MPAADSGQEFWASFTLRVGEKRELALPGLGTAGFLWSASLDGDAAAVELAWERGFGTDDSPRPVGASAPERLRITAAAPGRARIHLAQQRPWEQGRPLAAHTVDVEVLPPQMPAEPASQPHDRGPR
ncbi:MAG: protease inhibitor I42 family protein [Propionicimonas sp.]|uniref:protease inhibitor I42 family protein n=1 Tax=Propionicimonas sp. TaxID=1955623 RepID=UPI002B20C95C|nr:protease inhibitor I42 family protein [Propionicimonas sp.]MEA4943527.1 protease inhibitor I42 family protein [Propionicimonas sp.]